MGSQSFGVRGLVQLILAIIGVIIGIAYLLSVGSTPVETSTPIPTPTLVPARIAVGSGLPLRELWRKTLTTHLGAGSTDTSSAQTLVMTQEAAYVVEHHPVSSEPLAPWRIKAFDVETGNERWATEQLGHIHSLAVSQNALFVAMAYGIRAYDIINGERLWISDQPEPDHQGYFIVYDESLLKLIIVGLGDRSFLTISPQTGLVGEAVEVDDLVAIDARYEYLWNGKEFGLKNIAAKTVEWTIPFCCTLTPWAVIKTDSVLILPTVTSKAGWQSVFAIDREKGYLVWECRNCFASDVAVDGNTLYAILRDGSLGAYDLSTGQLRGVLGFKGGSEIEPLNTQYSVAASKGYVLLYFDDSQEIIALGP